MGIKYNVKYSSNDYAKADVDKVDDAYRLLHKADYRVYSSIDSFNYPFYTQILISPNDIFESEEEFRNRLVEDGPKFIANTFGPIMSKIMYEIGEIIEYMGIASFNMYMAYERFLPVTDEDGNEVVSVSDTRQRLFRMIQAYYYCSRIRRDYLSGFNTYVDRVLQQAVIEKRLITLAGSQNTLEPIGKLSNSYVAFISMRIYPEDDDTEYYKVNRHNRCKYLNTPLMTGKKYYEAIERLYRDYTMKVLGDG